MEKYIIFTGNITNMGGAQQYLSNKAKRLKAEGYDPVIISTRPGTVLLNNLKPFADARIAELRFRPFCYTARDRKRVLDKVLKTIGGNAEQDHFYIESNGVGFIEWAEMTAQALKSKHVCIDLQENHKYDPHQRLFLDYKYKRDELYGISPKSMQMILDNPAIGENDPHYILAECNNVAEDVSCTFLSDLPEADFNIGCIGRLEKPYVKNGVTELCEFANQHNDKKFNLILIGGGKKNEVEEIKKIVGECKNIYLHITGFMYPIPRELLHKIDCFFAAAGSARVSMNEGLPTISMNAENGKAMGILNYTTTNTLYGESEFSLSRYLAMVLFEGYCEKHETLKMEVSDYDPHKEFLKQLSFFDKNDGRYYDTSTMQAFKKKDKLYQFVGHLVGIKGLQIFYKTVSSVSRLIRNLIKKK